MSSPAETGGESTRAVHSGSPLDPSGAVATPIFQSATFGFAATDDLVEVASGRRPGNFYTRYSSPNQRAVEEKLAALEETKAALTFGSGMAAISTALLAHLRPGDRLAAYRDLYGGTLNFVRTVLVPLGVSVDWLDIGDDAALAAALARRPKVLYLETPTNPTLRIIDLESAARRARESGALTFVDNTFATPVNMKPIRLGASLSIHSATKYLGGHSDVTAGAVVGPREVVSKIEPFRKVLGGILSPHEAWLLERSLKTLPLRVERHNRNGQRMAEFLAEQAAVAAVH
ncbi:MAG: aminotransferase class I/II-fold pyridoxal phosphate-dependent enzyme, partial [Planctomycetes bacterium]|nr:aminotransferase class I/II-fold pyridoxal phosphate-dependent enzyme [Planctomycetota bacterium]